MKEEDFIRAISRIDMSPDAKDRMKEKLIIYQQDLSRMPLRHEQGRQIIGEDSVQRVPSEEPVRNCQEQGMGTYTDVHHGDISPDGNNTPFLSDHKSAEWNTTVVAKQGGRNMLKRKRLGGLIAVAVLALSITAFAATGIVSTWYSSSSSRPDYRTLPTAEQVKKDIGYDALLIDRFSNGYTFRDGSIVSNKLENDNQQAVEKFKSVTFRYQKGKDEVDFSQDRYTSRMETQGTVVDSVGETEIVYFSYVNKFVPPDYKLSAEERAAEENGELVFSYGSDQVELVTWQSVSWQIGEMHYELFQEVDENALTQEELVAMAREVISS